MPTTILVSLETREHIITLHSINKIRNKKLCFCSSLGRSASFWWLSVLVFFIFPWKFRHWLSKTFQWSFEKWYFLMSPIYNCELVQNVRHIPILISSTFWREDGGGDDKLFTEAVNTEINCMQVKKKCLHVKIFQHSLSKK